MGYVQLIGDDYADVELPSVLHPSGQAQVLEMLFNLSSGVETNQEFENRILKSPKNRKFLAQIILGIHDSESQ